MPLTMHGLVHRDNDGLHGDARAHRRLGRVSVQLRQPILQSGSASGSGEEALLLRVAPFEFDVTPPLGAPLMDGGCPAAAEILTPLTARVASADAANLLPPPTVALDHLSTRAADDSIGVGQARGIVLLGVPGGSVVLCSVDWTGIGNESHDRLRAALARGCGTAPDRVALHTIHQHDAPGSDSATERLLEHHGLSRISMIEPFLPDAAARFEAATRAAMAGGGIPVTHIGTGSAAVDVTVGGTATLYL